MDDFSCLPPSLLHKVLQYLRLNDAKHLMLTNSQNYSAIVSNEFWQNMCINKFQCVDSPSWINTFHEYHVMGLSLAECEKYINECEVTPKFQFDLAVLLTKRLLYYKSIHNKDKQIETLLQLWDINKCVENYHEAAKSLTEYAKMLEWNFKSVLPALFGFPLEPEFFRKERVIKLALRHFEEESERWEAVLNMNRLKEGYKLLLARPDLVPTKTVEGYLKELKSKKKELKFSEKSMHRSYCKMTFPQGLPKYFADKQFIIKFQDGKKDPLDFFVIWKSRFPSASPPACKSITNFSHQPRHVFSTLPTKHSPESHFFHWPPRSEFKENLFFLGSCIAQHVQDTSSTFPWNWVSHTYCYVEVPMLSYTNISEIVEEFERTVSPVEEILEAHERNVHELQMIMKEMKERKKACGHCVGILRGSGDFVSQMYSLKNKYNYFLEQGGHEQLLPRLRQIIKEEIDLRTKALELFGKVKTVENLRNFGYNYVLEMWNKFIEAPEYKTFM